MAERRRVLVVDDELRIVDFLATYLSVQGYTVEDAADGAETIALLDAHRLAPRYGLVLLDLSLPLVDGFAVLRHLAATGNTIPVIAMSSDSDGLSTAHALGAVATAPKPFALADLLALVAAHYHSGPE